MTVLMGLPLIVLSDVTNRHTILCDTGQLNKEHQQCLKSLQAQQVSMTMCSVLCDHLMVTSGLKHSKGASFHLLVAPIPNMVNVLYDLNDKTTSLQ